MPLRTSARKKTAAAPPVNTEDNKPAAKANGTKKAAAAAPKSKAAAASSTGRKRKAAAETESEDKDKHECDSHDEKDDDEEDDEEEPKKKTQKKPAAKKRKAAAPKKAADEMAPPLAPRTAVASLGKAMYIGAHVSAAGGVQNALPNATHIGANALALFLKSQRKWTNPPLTPPTTTAFAAAATTHAFQPALHILPHGSYLVNLAQPDEAKAAQAYTSFLDDLQRCDALGIKLYNFHPGSTGGSPMAEATGRIAAQLNRAHAATTSVITVLENMCGHGNIIGGRFEDLREIIDGVEDKARVGVCLDTCHSFAAGYDLRTPEAFAETMAEFDRVIGLGYLKALHLNDSKAPLGSHRDLHANIGTGFLGLRAFHNVMNYDGFQGMPMVLETPIDRKGSDGKSVEDKQVWADEIKLLEGLIGTDPEGEAFKADEARLWAEGEGERKRVQAQVDAKAAKDAKKGGKKGGGRKKKGAAEETDEDDE